MRLIIPNDITKDNCSYFVCTLDHVAQVATPQSLKHKSNNGRYGNIPGGGGNAFDGIRFPSENTFWCGIVHDQPNDNICNHYDDHIVFCADKWNLDRFQYSSQKEATLSKPNYIIGPNAPCNWLPARQTKYGNINNTVVFQSSFSRPLFNLAPFFGLSNWDLQCDWLYNFMKQASMDIAKFEAYSGPNPNNPNQSLPANPPQWSPKPLNWPIISGC